MSCDKYCEEVIPTYNCDKQMNEKKYEAAKLLEALKQNCTRLITSMPELLKELSEDTPLREPTIVSISNDIRSLSYEDKQQVFEKCFSVNTYGPTIDNKLILISLLSTFYIAIRKNDPDKTLRETVDMLITKPEISVEEKDRLAIMTEEFLIGVTKGNTFGLKTGREIKEKINEIISEYLPF